MTNTQTQIENILNHFVMKLGVAGNRNKEIEAAYKWASVSLEKVYRADLEEHGMIDHRSI